MSDLILPDNKLVGVDNYIPNTLKIKNAVIGALTYEHYSIRIFTMGDSKIHTPDLCHFIITKDSDVFNIHQICKLKITKPEYIYMNNVKLLELSEQEAMDLYNYLCGYNFDYCLNLFADQYIDKSYTVFTNYIRFLNTIHEQDDDWTDIPLDTACPKYTGKMETAIYN